jgi:hypothetical protein
MPISTFIKIELRHSTKPILDLEKVASNVPRDSARPVIFGETITIVVVRWTRSVFLKAAVQGDGRDVEIGGDLVDRDEEGGNDGRSIDTEEFHFKEVKKLNVICEWS